MSRAAAAPRIDPLTQPRKGTALLRRTITAKLAAFLTIVVATSACSAADDPQRVEASPPTDSSPATTASPTGSETTSKGMPAARCYAVMTDAPGRTGVLLFGGWDDPEAPDSPWQGMWAFRPATGWSELADPTPGGGGGDVFGYDAQSDRAVFLEVSGATWAFNPSTKTWKRRQPKDAPSLHGARLVYDSESDRLITFGGDDFSTLFDDTWAYDYETDTWTKMDPAKRPPARSFYAMAYDERSDRVVVFGGF
ncbi:MAG: hypothetical protein HYU54_09580, partial [Actinobacteria bacterium]|nr:hypothetical protein [Actinomycetota bacterium]